jgi:hypothetical protein
MRRRDGRSAWALPAVHVSWSINFRRRLCGWSCGAGHVREQREVLAERIYWLGTPNLDCTSGDARGVELGPRALRLTTNQMRLKDLLFPTIRSAYAAIALPQMGAAHRFTGLLARRHNIPKSGEAAAATLSLRARSAAFGGARTRYVPGAQAGTTLTKPQLVGAHSAA